MANRRLEPVSLGSLPGPGNILRRPLDNGITILARENFNSPVVVINGYLEAGSLFDPDDKLGLATFTSLALMRGTAPHSFQQIYDLLETAGASLSISGGTHMTSFRGKALAEDYVLLLDLLHESLHSPVFPEEQVERLRSQILTSLAIKAQDTAEMASRAFDQILYAGHPYSRPDDGTPESISSIKIEHLVSFHQKNYGPKGMVISIVGAVEAERAAAEVADHFYDWVNPEQPLSIELLQPTTLSQRERRQVTIPGKSQADLLVGACGPARRSPDYLAAALGNSVLGQFGMYGRIGESVREKSGLAYYALSNVSGGIGPGPWYATAGVDPANIEQAINLIFEEFERFTREPVTLEELDDSKANFIGRLPITMETNSGVAGAILNLERYQLGLDYYLRLPGLLQEITPEDVLETARCYLNTEMMAVAVAGP
jgi:zinc protease